MSTSKTETAKPRCKATVASGIFSFSYGQCSRPAGHGLGGCFCKQHSKQALQSQKADLEYWQRQKESEAKSAADRATKLELEIVELSAKLQKTNETAAVRSHQVKAARAALDRIYEEAGLNNAKA